MESVGDTMLVSEAIKTVRRRVNDEYDSGYSDEDIIGYLNDAIKYLASAMIVRCDPVLIKEYDISGTSSNNPVPKNFARFAGGYPVRRNGSNFLVTDGSPIVTTKYFYYPDNVTDLTDELPFSDSNMLLTVIINLTCIYALNKHEFNVQQDEVLRNQLEDLINTALGAVE